MEILQLIDEFESTVEDTARVPLTGKILIHEDTIYSFLDKIRVMLPEAVREADWVMRERERILAEAEREAETIIETANKKLLKITGESEIMKMAKAQGDEIIENAKKAARDLTQGSFNYADEVMNQLQGELEKILLAVRKGKEELRANLREQR